MQIKLGTLTIVPVHDRMDLIADPVAQALTAVGTSEIGVTEIDPTLSDTAAFCAHYQVGLDRAANCVVLEATRAKKSWFAACVIAGNTRADVNGLARRTLDARKVSFAPMEAAVAQTGMEYGGITAVGLPPEWPLLIDQAVTTTDYVIIGSGIRKSKLVVPGPFLASLPHVQVLDGLGKVTTSM